METANHLVPVSTDADGSSWRRGTRLFAHWLNRRRVFLLGGGVIVASIALALGQRWVTLGALVPLLWLSPCLVMMTMCMKGRNSEEQAVPARATDKPTVPTSL
jgi:hypothetical protein